MWFAVGVVVCLLMLLPIAVELLKLVAAWREPPKRRRPPRGGGPTCDTLRRRFRVGMPRDEFFATCDDLLPLQLTSPTLDMNVVGIRVADGGVVLFLLSEDRGLLTAERDGEPFLLE